MRKVFPSSVNLEWGQAGGLSLTSFDSLSLDSLGLDSLELNPQVWIFAEVAWKKW